MTTKSKIWKYVITKKDGSKLFTDLIVGDVQDRSSFVLVELSRKEDGVVYKKLTLSCDMIDTVEENMSLDV